MLAAQTAVLLSTYLRMLGYEARAHTATCSDVDLNRLAVAAGLAEWPSGCATLRGRALRARRGDHDARARARPAAGPALSGCAPTGRPGGSARARRKNAFNREPYRGRDFRRAPIPFEKLSASTSPRRSSTHARVPRFPKRADFFARALFGDMGKNVQDSAKNAHYVLKSPIGACARRALGALLLLQFGEARGPVTPGVATRSETPTT